jgi:cytochrome c oxidase assembly factor CtaG
MHAGVIALLHVGTPAQDTAWGFEPGIVIPLVVCAVWYMRGLSVMRQHAPRMAHGWRSASFAAGWITLVVALASPLHGISEQLFSAHMIQHELLMALAAPLLVLARPVPVFLWALPMDARRTVGAAFRRPALRSMWHTLTRPFDAWLLHGAAIWLWHVPLLFESTLTSEWAHAAQHASFLGSALVFWWSMLYGQRRASRGLSIIYLFTTAVHTSVLGALLTFSRGLWYPAYAATTAAWGIAPLADQQLAGLIMWVPASIAYLIAALAIMHRWLRDSEWENAPARGDLAPAPR